MASNGVRPSNLFLGKTINLKYISIHEMGV